METRIYIFFHWEFFLSIEDEKYFYLEDFINRVFSCVSALFQNFLPQILMIGILVHQGMHINYQGDHSSHFRYEIFCQFLRNKETNPISL